MYETAVDPYCYPGTTVLINKLDLRDQKQLDAFEAEITSQRASEPLPVGHFDTAHYLAIHAHLFQDVFEWAGTIRTVRIAKDGNMFCYPEYIDAELTKLFGNLRAASYHQNLSAEAYARSSAHLVADLNAIHPFREGNGRTQLGFLTLLSQHAAHPLDLKRLTPTTMLDAIIRSFDGDETDLAATIAALLDREG